MNLDLKHRKENSMTDKVQKIREEVERLQIELIQEKENGFGSDVDDACILELQNVLTYIDSLQEEPASSVWHDASEPPIIDKTFLLVAPNGNSSLCLWGGKELHSVTIGGGHSVLCKGDIYSYIDDLLNLDNFCNFRKNLQEEPVSEDLEEAAEKYAYELCPSIGVANTEAEQSFKAGAKWQKEHLWKSADGDDLPEIDREVVAFQETFPTDVDAPSLFKIVMAHRPNPKGYDGKSIATGKVEHYTPKTYDKGGWNIPNLVFWLDLNIPNLEED